MPKRMFRKYLPSAEKIRQSRSLGFLGAVLGDPNLWHINRHSLAGAAFIGIFSALVPVPLQMVLAAFLAVRFKCNLPLSVVIVWLTNPFTIVPIFYFTYRVGAWLLGMPITPPDNVSFSWLLEQLIPLWVGSILCGLIFGGLAWATIKIIWRIAVARNWSLRRKQRFRRMKKLAEDSKKADQEDTSRPS